MKLAKRLCSILLAVVMILSLLSGCGVPVATGDPSANIETVTDMAPTAESKPAASFELTADDKALLDSLDKATFEYFKTWISMVLPERNCQIEALSGSDKLYINIENTNIQLVAMPQENDPEHFDSFSIWLFDNATEDNIQLYRDLCIAAAMWFYEGLAEEDASILFDIEPVADETFFYESDKPIDAYYHPEQNHFIAGYQSPHHHLSSGYLLLTTYMEEDRRCFTVRPPVLCEEIVLELQEQINDALAQAGHPISLSFSLMPDHTETVINYTGSGEDLYTDHMEVYLEKDENGPYDLSAYISDGVEEETRDAMRTIFSTTASFCDDQFTKEYFDAFYELENHKDSDVAVYNQYGAYVQEEFGGFAIRQDQGKYEIHYSENYFSVRRIDDFKEKSQAVDINALLTQFSQKHSGFLDTNFILSLEQVSYTVIHPEKGDQEFNIYFNFRRPDLAVTRIDITYVTDGDEEKKRWFQGVTADLAALCSTDLTSEDAKELYAQAISIGPTGSLLINSYSEAGMSLNFEQFPSMIKFSIEFDLDPLPPSENIFSELNAWGGPSVIDGQFYWMSTYDYYENEWTYYMSGIELKKWTDIYFENVGVNAYFEDLDRTVTTDNDGIPYRSHQIGIDGIDYLNKEHYSLTMVFDSYPHFLMNYNDNYSKLMGLEDGYYYKGASVEEIRHIPMCLSLLCDDGMTVVETQELFSHLMEPDKIIDGTEVTIYCPREVAHILAYDPNTDKCEYTVMTKVDFENTYGSLDTFIQIALSDEQ